MFWKKAENGESYVKEGNRNWRRLIGRVGFGVGAIGYVLPQVTANAAGTAPSDYVNKISDGLFQQILSVAPKVALLVIAWCVIMYLMSGDDHKKSKYRSSAIIALVTYLVLLVLQPLIGWLQGLV